jgi:hypothetical protein
MKFTIKQASWLLVSLLSLVLLTIQGFSVKFDYFTPVLQRPTQLIVALMLIAGLIYLIIIKNILLKRITFNLVPLFIIGLLLRILFLQSTPVYEDDFYRYFFDGSLTSQGLNPYNYAPEDALKRPSPERNNILGLNNKAQPAHPELSFLADQELIERVAYPHIRTIYPPVTQAIFTLSYSIEPFSLMVWRGLLILFEVISFMLMLKLLKCMNKPMIWSAIYWLNPLLITETINAGHMDALLVPVLLLTLLLATKKNYSLAGLALAIAVGIKVWPVLLIPSLFRPLLLQPKKLLLTILPCCLTMVLVLLPQLLSYTNEQSGLMNYSQYWRTNSFIFGLLEDSLIYLEQSYAYYFGDPQQIARFIVGGIISILVIFQLKKNCENTEQLTQYWLVIIVCLFFLSPTGYPWYFIWFLPLLTLKPNLPLLSLTMLLPLYDLRYPLAELNKTELFNDIIIPLQFIPPILLLLHQWYKNKTKANINEMT